MPLHDTPLLNEIKSFIEKNQRGFHTPGHQGGQGLNPVLTEMLEKYFLKMDLTELPGLDNLRNPQGCIREAQGLAARLYGACKTFFLVNGSSVGLQASILALNKESKKALISRQAHISVLNGLILSGAYPLLIPTVLDREWGIPLGSRIEVIEEFATANSAAQFLLITQPSYHGLGQDLAGIKNLCHKFAIPLIADEAHGAHLYFQEQLPLSAQRIKADIVVQSTHKTLGALTQASMLHVNDPRWEGPVKEALDILQTTSPSYLLLASLDSVQEQMYREGAQILNRTWELGARLTAAVRRIPGFRVLADEIPDQWRQDPAKLVISGAGLGLRGWELARILRENYGIQVELSDYYYILLLITPGHNSGDVEIVKRALMEISRSKGKSNALQPWPCPLDLYEGESRIFLTPREVYLAVRRDVNFCDAVNEIAGRALTIYPPGIPLIWPGQKYTRAHLEYISWCMSNGLVIHGLEEEHKICIVEKL